MSPEPFPPNPPALPDTKRDTRRDSLELMRKQRCVGGDHDDDRARALVIVHARALPVHRTGAADRALAEPEPGRDSQCTAEDP